MKKINIAHTGENILSIMGRGFSLYFKNLLPLTKIMIFPVFGQILGIFVVFFTNYLYVEKYLLKMPPESLSKNIFVVFTALIILMLPGFAIFFKAFWDFTVSLASLNTIAVDIEEKGFWGSSTEHHNKVKMQAGKYLSLLLILTCLYLIPITIPFITLLFAAKAYYSGMTVIMLIFLVVVCAEILLSIPVLIYLSTILAFCFQIFAFENLSPKHILIKSNFMIKGNFFRTLFMGVVLLFVTTVLVPGIISSLMEKSFIAEILSKPFTLYINAFTVNNPEILNLLVKMHLTPSKLGSIMLLSTITTAATFLMLPLGSACFTFLYRDILKRQVKK